MKIIVDVMGGDRAPEETVRGVFLAADELNARYILVGNRPDIERIAAEEQFDLRRVEIIHTDVAIEMEDEPLSVVRAKKNSSMALGLHLLSEGKGDAFVSAGNTGALFAGATLITRKIKGVQRAGIGSILPFQNPVLLLDAGANIAVNEENLLQFAMMGSAYMKHVHGVENPRVGLLNNGSESHKGTPLQQTAFVRLSESPAVNFVGNVEANILPFDVCDVLVTDGFTGNILLKCVEGCGKILLGRIKDILYSTPATKLAALTMKKPLTEMKRDYDPSERGGAPILGISKPVIKAHGSSDAKAIKNAIRQAIEYSRSGAIYSIAEEIRNTAEN
ncbi:MAG: phosphate acyltransferase PlsX [Clostridia bacterium]|nr:phosphate acyltransferase PlsX [Clostridia bacterium]